MDVGPRERRISGDRDEPIGAVPRLATELGVGLDATERRQDVREGPARVAATPPRHRSRLGAPRTANRVSHDVPPSTRPRRSLPVPRPRRARTRSPSPAGPAGSSRPASPMAWRFEGPARPRAGSPTDRRVPRAGAPPRSRPLPRRRSRHRNVRARPWDHPSRDVSHPSTHSTGSHSPDEQGPRGRPAGSPWPTCYARRPVERRPPARATMAASGSLPIRGRPGWPPMPEGDDGPKQPQVMADPGPDARPPRVGVRRHDDHDHGPGFDRSPLPGRGQPSRRRVGTAERHAHRRPDRGRHQRRLPDHRQPSRRTPSARGVGPRRR